VRVLIVDDSPLFRDLIRRSVEGSAHGEVVGEAETAEEATAAVGEHRPDVVIMDWSLPDRDGIWATQQIKALFPQVDVLALTSTTDDRVMEQFAAAGATAVVDKGRLEELSSYLS
jgi:DNA-binding NarL/FixJ family response regulator